MRAYRAVAALVSILLIGMRRNMGASGVSALDAGDLHWCRMKTAQRAPSSWQARRCSHEHTRTLDAAAISPCSSAPAYTTAFMQKITLS